jgi:hypothetical protein
MYYNRTAMMMSYDAGAGWWTFIISTPSNILGTYGRSNNSAKGWQIVRHHQPTSLSTNTILSNLNLLWTASTDAVGVTNYLIYRNGTCNHHITPDAAGNIS